MTTTLNEVELAARWGMSPKTLQRWPNFADIEEILLYLQQTGEASLDQIQVACLSGKQS